MTIETYVVDQSGAGTTEIVAAVPGRNIAVLNYALVLGGEGTLAFSDGTEWLSGDMPLAANGGVAASAGAKGKHGPHDAPLMLTKAPGRPLSITTTGASAHGHVCVEIR